MAAFEPLRVPAVVVTIENNEILAERLKTTMYSIHQAAALPWKEQLQCQALLPGATVGITVMSGSYDCEVLIGLVVRWCSCTCIGDPCIYAAAVAKGR